MSSDASMIIMNGHHETPSVHFWGWTSQRTISSSSRMTEIHSHVCTWIQRRLRHTFVVNPQENLQTGQDETLQVSDPKPRIPSSFLLTSVFTSLHEPQTNMFPPLEVRESFMELQWYDEHWWMKLSWNELQDASAVNMRVCRWWRLLCCYQQPGGGQMKLLYHF